MPDIDPSATSVRARSRDSNGSMRAHAPTTVPQRRVMTYVVLTFVLGIVASSFVTASVMSAPKPSVEIVTPASGAGTSKSFAVEMRTHAIGLHDSVWLLEDTGGPDYFPMQAKEVRRDVWLVPDAYVFDAKAAAGTARTLVAYVASEQAGDAFDVYTYLGNKDHAVFGIGMHGLPHGLRAQDRVTVRYGGG